MATPWIIRNASMWVVSWDRINRLLAVGNESEPVPIGRRWLNIHVLHSGEISGFFSSTPGHSEAGNTMFSVPLIIKNGIAIVDKNTRVKMFNRGVKIV